MNIECNADDYETAKKVWELFDCKTLLDYHNIYLTSDVLLLAVIWGNFKEVCYKIYNLDVSYDYTAPSLSWDAYLKHTTEKYKKQNKEFKILLLTDMEMYQLVEESIREGLLQISKRYAKANHSRLDMYCKGNRSNKVMDEYILYLDANDLHGYAMCRHLSIDNWDWNNEEWNKEKIMSLDNKGSRGYLFSVDLEYAKELHDLHNGYPFVPENQVIENRMLNYHQRVNRNNSKIKKLVTSFYDKKRYGLNYRILKLYL